jgi:glycosyltransferase involved in cell wall biosynthesis
MNKAKTPGNSASTHSGSPLVSVIMSVYNAGSYLSQAIDSILSQTYKNFEFIIVDDGSTDDSYATINKYSDKRLKVFHNKNQGLQKSLNFGISKATGKYVARMDQDDVSAPQRIEKQVRLLEKNSQIAILGTSFSLIDERGKLINHSYHLDRPEDLKLEFFTRNPFGHGTVMLRKSILEDVGAYDEKEQVEDYELWYRILKKHDGMSLAEELYSWRVLPSSMSHSASDDRQQMIHDFIKKVWAETLLPAISVKYLRGGIKHYSRVSEGHLEQYRFMLATLCLGAYRMGHRSYAAKLLLNLILARARVFPAFRMLRKDPLSHNYLLGLIHPN